MKSFFKHPVGFLKEARGSALVETSLALLVIFPLFFSVFELCMFAYTQAILGDAARVGIRYAIVHGIDSTICSGPTTGCSDPSGTNVIAAVQNYAAVSSKSLSGITVAPTWPDASSTPPSRIIIAVTYNYVPMFATTGFHISMHAKAEGRIVY